MSSYVYSSILNDANNFRYIVLNIKKNQRKKVSYSLYSEFVICFRIISKINIDC